MTNPIAQLAHDFVSAVNARDAAAIAELLSEDYIDHNPAVENGRAGNQAFWQSFFTAFPDVTATAEEVIATEDRLVGRFSYEATHRGDFLGAPATGKPVSMRTIDIFHVRDGRLVEHWDEINLLEVLQQVGLIPAGPEAA